MAEAIPEDFRSLTTGKSAKLYTQTAEITGIDAINPRGGIPDVRSDGATARELISIVDIDLDSAFPEVRTNIGEGHVWTHGSPDISLPFIAEGDTDAEKFFQDRHTVNPTTRELRVFPWLFRKSNQKGETLEYIVRAKLTHLRTHKQRGEQGEFITAFGMLRVLDMVPLVRRMGSLYLRSVSISGSTVTLTFNRGLLASSATDTDSYSHPGIVLRSSSPISYTAGATDTSDSTVTLTASGTIEAGTYAITALASLQDTESRRLGRDQTKTVKVV